MAGTMAGVRVEYEVAAGVGLSPPPIETPEAKERSEMTRSPLVVAAVLAAGLVLAACGAAPAGHGAAPKGSSSTSAKATPTPTAKALSAAAAAEAGFRAWAEASVILTGGGPGGMPAASFPAAATDLLVLGRAYALPGWRTALGKGLVLVETPTGCQASIQHVEGSFSVPARSGSTALVVAFYGACVTTAGGTRYVVEPASHAPTAAGTYVLLGSMVPLPPVGGLPDLPKTVWTPTVVATCTTGWVQGAGAQLPGGVVPGC